MPPLLTRIAADCSAATNTGADSIVVMLTATLTSEGLALPRTAGGAGERACPAIIAPAESATSAPAMMRRVIASAPFAQAVFGTNESHRLGLSTVIFLIVSSLIPACL